MTGKLKITILGSAWPLRGGLASYNERMAREFAAQGHDVCIETFSLQYPSILFPGKTQYSDSPKPENLNVRASVNSINPLNWIKIGRRIKKQKPDLLIIKFWLPFMAPCFSTIACIARKNKHTRVVSVLDNIIPHEKRPGDFFLAKMFVKQVDGFIAMSQSVMDDLAEFDRQKPRKLSPHPLFDNFGAGVSRKEALGKLGLDPAFRYILFFGFIRDYKGLDILLKAMNNTGLKNKPVRLLVAGEYYNNAAQYQQIIKEEGIEDQLVLRNVFIADEEVRYYFCAADIIAQPYKSATQSGVTQIAYHFEKPMLVTNVGGLPEIVPHEKVGYVTAPDPEKIAGALNRFFDEGKADRFLEGILDEKRKYSWKQLTENILSLMNI